MYFSEHYPYHTNKLHICQGKRRGKLYTFWIFYYNKHKIFFRKKGPFMKKQNAAAIVWIGIIAFVVVILLAIGFSAEEDYARITDVSYKAVVVDEPGGEGKVLITERLTFDVHAASEGNLFWELWRDLPESYVDGVKVDYTVHSVKQILEDGTEIIYEESPKLYWDDYDYVEENTLYGPGKWFHSEGPYDEEAAQYECVLFYVDGIYREEMVFEIEYEMHNASLRYNDCSDLYLAMYSGETIKYLESYEAEILFPDKDMPSQGNYKISTYGTNANEFPVEESATKNPGYYTFYFSLDEEDLQFKDYNQYIEFDLVAFGEDKHIFAEYANENYYTDDDVLGEILADQEEYATAPERFATAKAVVLVISILLSVLVIWSIFWMQNKKKKQYSFFEPLEKYAYYYDVPSDLDPHFARAFVLCKENASNDFSGVYAALLLSLARKKYVNLIERSSDDVMIQLTPSEETLTPCEKHYYNLLVRHAKKQDHILMSEFQNRVAQDYENTQNFTQKMNNEIRNIGLKEGYFQNGLYMQPRKDLESYAIFLAVVGLIFIIVVNLISMLTRLDLAYGAFFIFGIACLVGFYLLQKQAGKYVLLTQKGANEYEKWRGFYNFLQDETQIQNRADIDIEVMERYLVYATAFGFADKLNSTLGLRFPEASTSSSIVHNRVYRSGRIHTSSSRFHSSVQTSVSYASSGGGGGYGGGGRGGGGGGGGH